MSTDELLKLNAVVESFTLSETDQTNVNSVFGGTFEDVAAAVRFGYFLDSDGDHSDLEIGDYFRLHNTLDSDNTDMSGDYVVKEICENDETVFSLEPIARIPTEFKPQATPPAA